MLVVNIEGCIAYTTLTIRVLPNPTNLKENEVSIVYQDEDMIF